MLDLLKSLIEINSIFPNENEIGNFLFDYIKKSDFEVEKQYINSNRFNILAERGKGDKSFLLYAHMDTVPVYGNWKDNPFKLRIEDDKAIGLGSADMKAGIVAIINAVDSFFPKNYKLKVCFGVDEENYSEGAFKLSETDWINDIKGVLIPESPLPAHKSLKAGSTITIGRKGRSVFTIKIYGKSAHGVNPQKGINAIEQASKLVNYLNEFEKTSHHEMGENSYFIRRFEGKTNSLSIPDYTELEFDCHLVYPETSETLKIKLHNFISNLYDKCLLTHGEKDFELELSNRPTPYLEPFIVDKNDFLLKISTQAVKEVYGEVYFNYGQSVADENVFGSKNISTLTLGPLGDNHHSAEEWVSINSLEKLKNIYHLILKNLDF